MSGYALITGASSGIGLELARIHAEHGDNLVLVARRRDRLQQIKTELEEKHKVDVRVIEMDLSRPGAPARLHEELSGQAIDYLINNAGVGSYGPFADSDWQQEQKMIQLNVTALTELCRLFLPDMLARGKGRIMNVSSTAAFQPGPLMTVYYASKAFVLHFSEALAEEVRGTGVTITALCPGATSSGFFAAADMESSNLIKGRKLPTSRAVAEHGYRKMIKGKAVTIHGLFNRLLAWSVRVSPRFLVPKVVKQMQKRVD